MEDTIYQKAIGKALYYLTQQERTEKQLHDYLKRKEFPSAIIHQVLAQMKDWGYLNDVRFAERYASVRQHKGGRRKVKMELMRAGIDRDTAQETVEALSEEEELSVAIGFAEKSLRGQTDDAAYRRAYASLQRRGYDGRIIRQAMQTALTRLRMREEEEETEE